MIPKQTAEQNIADFKVSLMPIRAEYILVNVIKPYKSVGKNNLEQNKTVD